MELGIKVKDKVTGFEGTVVGFVQYLTGCNQALVVPPMRDGKMIDGNWIDVQRLDRVGDSQIVLNNADSPGCDLAPPLW